MDRTEHRRIGAPCHGGYARFIDELSGLPEVGQ
jgi:hypothetical protein